MKSAGAARRGSGFSGKVILLLIAVTVTSGGFLLGYFVGKSVNVPPATQPQALKQGMAGNTVAGRDAAPAVEKNSPSAPPRPASPPAQSGPISRAVVSEDHEQKSPRPSAATNEKPAVAGETKNAGGGGTVYTLQVGAFKNQKEAESLRARLDGKGYRAYTRKTASKGTTLYKVMVGEFTRKKEAEVFALKLQNMEGLNAYISAMNRKDMVR
jgi:cell division septation protein DedD